jgi:hypothetical protein
MWVEMTEDGRSERVGERALYCQMTAAKEKPQHFGDEKDFYRGSCIGIESTEKSIDGRR